MSKISKIKNNKFMEPHQNRLINLAFCWAIISSLTLLAQTMDICQCGPRCADYEEERLCARLVGTKDSFQRGQLNNRARAEGYRAVFFSCSSKTYKI
jgi:hypothetical protein